MRETLVDYLVATTPLNWDPIVRGMTQNVVGGTGGMPIQVGGDAHFHGPLTSGTGAPVERPFSDASHLRWLDPSATLLSDGRLVVEVYVENSGPGESGWSAIYKDGELIEGFKTDASLVVEIVGNGVVRIVDDRNMDATSTKATRNQRYKEWVDAHGDPTT